MNNLKLLQQIKDKLSITWDDEVTKRNIERIFDSAIFDLKRRLGIIDNDFDFSTPGAENTLLLNYVLYEYNHCLEEFFTNYQDMILSVRAEWEVKYYKQHEEVSK